MSARSHCTCTGIVLMSFPESRHRTLRFLNSWLNARAEFTSHRTNPLWPRVTHLLAISIERPHSPLLAMASLLQLLGDFPRVSESHPPLETHLTRMQRLAAFLDRPGFPWKGLILGFSLGQFALEGLLSLRQYSYLQRKKPPKTLEDEISQEVFDKSQVRTYHVEYRVRLTVLFRHTGGRRPSLVLCPGSTPRSRMCSSSNTTSCPRFGL